MVAGFIVVSLIDICLKTSPFVALHSLLTSMRLNGREEGGELGPNFSSNETPRQKQEFV
jgi:hypothetical protein